MSKTKKIFTIVFLIFFIGILIYVGIDLINPIKEAIKSKDLYPVEQRFVEYGIYKYLFIIICQAACLVAAIVPTEFIQIIAGFSCGLLKGFLTCMIGIFLGNIIIFILCRFVKSFKNEKPPLVDNGKVNKTFLIALSFYFIPGISYGSAAIYAANTKMNFFKYILLTTLGAIPAVASCTLFGEIAINEKFLGFTIWFSFYCLVIMLAFAIKNKIKDHLQNTSLRIFMIFMMLLVICFGFSTYFAFSRHYLYLFISMGVFIFLVLLYLSLKKLFHLYFLHLRHHFDMNYFQNKVKTKPSFLYKLVAFLIKIFYFPFHNIKVNKETIPDIKGPAIILFNHPSAYDFLYTAIPLYPKQVHFVVAYYYFCNYHLGRLLKTTGNFPKYLYQPDVSTMKNIIRVLNENGIVALAPEGRLSPHGTIEKIIPTTANMLKGLKVNVYICQIDGAYFTNPKWAIKKKKGRIDISYKQIFTSESLNSLSVDDIYQILLNECHYDDYKWLNKENVTFKGKKFIEGLEDILYICPNCHHEFSYVSKKDTMTCQCCQTKVTLNSSYQLISENKLIPKTITSWYNYQKEIEGQNILNDNYELKSHVILKMPDSLGRGFIKKGEGMAILNKKGFTYQGTIDNQDVTMFIKIKNIPVILFGVRVDFEFYYNNNFYYFVPDNIKECVKWSIVGELLHDKYSEIESGC